MTIKVLATFALIIAGTRPSNGDEPSRNVDGIMDNSFFVEEAYNQEAGVVQHILTSFYGVNKLRGTDEKNLEMSFTQEWPFLSQAHQLSYTVPYSFERTTGTRDGIGDILLNYRYQAYLDESNWRAFAPRLSLVLPTGNERRGFGDNSWGYQVNLPFSTAIGDKWYVHANAGATYLPNSGHAPSGDLMHYNVGASAIYCATPDLHLMLEWIGSWEEDFQDSGKRQHDFATLISPGIRKAFNFDNDSQLVLGLAAPIGLSGPAPDYGVFFYVSFEHFFKRSESR